MSGWTILTVRGRENRDYDYSRWDDAGRWEATADLAAAFEAISRVRGWKTWNGHVYGYLNSKRYDFDFAEELLADVEAALDDAVVLGANDTTDTGTARYYPTPEGHTDMYAETQGEDGYYVGEVALSVINARHGIVARDPFHNQCGRLDEQYLDDGQLTAFDGVSES